MKGLTIFLFGFAVTAAAVFAGGTTEGAAEREQVLTWSLGQMATDDARLMAEAYNAQSKKYEIVFEDALAGMEMRSEGVPKLRTALLSGSGPDFMANVNHGAPLSSVVETGTLLDLTETYADNGWDAIVPQAMIEKVTRDGHIYALPSAINTVGMYYNKDIYTKLGLKEPANFEAFITNMKALKDAGYFPNVLGLAGGWPAAFQASQYGYISGGSEYLAAMKGEIPWTKSPATLKAMTWYQTIGTEYSNPDVTALDWQQASELFYAGKAAMLLNTTSAYGGFLNRQAEGQIDFEIGFFTVPPINPKTDISIFGGIGSVFIVAKDGNTKGAIDYLNWLIKSEEGARSNLEIARLIPVVSKLPGDINSYNIAPLFKSMVEFTLANINNVGDWPAAYMPDYLFANYNQYVQGLMLKDLTPEQMLEKLWADRQRYDKENKK